MKRRGGDGGLAFVFEQRPDQHGGRTGFGQALPKLVARGDTVALLDPMYGEYRHLTETVLGARIAPCELQEAAGYAPDPRAIAATANAARA